MPLTEKGKEILAAMKEQYGEEKGEQVFYASKNKGIITGVDMATKDVADPRIESINDEDVPEEEKEDEDTNDAFLVYNKNRHKKIGDADDPDMHNGQETEDAPGIYSRGRRARKGSPLRDTSDKGVGKKPSFLTTHDSRPTLQQMNRNNRDFWQNGPRHRGRGR